MCTFVKLSDSTSLIAFDHLLNTKHRSSSLYLSVSQGPCNPLVHICLYVAFFLSGFSKKVFMHFISCALSKSTRRLLFIFSGSRPSFSLRNLRPLPHTCGPRCSSSPGFLACKAALKSPRTTTFLLCDMSPILLVISSHAASLFVSSDASCGIYADRTTNGLPCIFISISDK